MSVSAADREQVYRADLESEKKKLLSELYFSLKRLPRQRLEVGWRSASSERLKYLHKRSKDIFAEKGTENDQTQPVPASLGLF